jgi:hypothetical protein
MRVNDLAAQKNLILRRPPLAAVSKDSCAKTENTADVREEDMR